MTIVRVGATKKYSEGWDSAFGKAKKPAGTKAAAKKSAKAPAKSSMKKAAKKGKK